MPLFRKLNPAETAANPPPRSARAQIAQAYAVLLVDFAIGEYGRAELLAGERRDIVRSRLHAAARRRGLALRFRPGPSAALIFRVEASQTMSITSGVVEADSRPEGVSPQRVIKPRRQDQERRPAGRYDDVLPRWMREGQRTGQGDGKRRQGR
jgi:hypothetical protein